MTNPILSREEIIELMYACNLPPECEPALIDFAERIESAVREKVCGEPVAWRAPNLSGSGGAWAYRDADDRFENQHGEPVGEALYAINGGKA